MKITEQQLEKISTLHCERLSSNEANMYLIDGFYNATNNNIAEVLLNDAYKEDEANEIAYYLVKNKDGDILFFFSLKCGVLYDEFLEGEKLRSLTEFYDYICKMIVDDKVEEEERKLLCTLLEKTRAKRGLKKVDVAKILHKSKETDAVEKMFNSNMKNVGKTYSGVELVHFCANDATRDKWNNLGLNQKLGALVFWNFVVPIVKEVMKHIGCEYIYLFAADMTEDEELIKYYKTNLNFRDSYAHNTAIPLYDFACKFMCQETTHLIAAQEHFFNNFNKNNDVVMFPYQTSVGK